MSRLIFPFLLLAVIFTGVSSTSTSFAAEGGFVGGGGKGVSCNGQLRILDFYEADLRGKTLLPAEKDYRSNLIKYGLTLVEYMRTNRLTMSGDDIVEFARVNIDARVRYVDPDKSLPITNDATLPPMSSGCEVVQIAVWANDGYIYVDKNLWSKLDSQNQAGLMLHEYLYSQAREYGWRSSDQSRLVIGEVFSSAVIDGKLTPVFKSAEYMDCRSPRDEASGEETYFMAIDEKQDGVAGVGFYFDILKGQIKQTRTYGFQPGLKLSDFGKRNFKALTVFVENESLGERLFVDLAKVSAGKFAAKGYARGTAKPEAAITTCKLLK